MVVRARTVRANELEFGLLEAGTGPLALCLHGFPDSAHTWQHLLPALADAGFHAVAPFMRGYAPTAVPDDGCFGIEALVADAVALHQVLDGDAPRLTYDRGPGGRPFPAPGEAGGGQQTHPLLGHRLVPIPGAIDRLR